MIRYACDPTLSTLLTETKVGGVTGISTGAGTLAVSVTYNFDKGCYKMLRKLGEASNSEHMQNYKSNSRGRVLTHTMLDKMKFEQWRKAGHLADHVWSTDRPSAWSCSTGMD